MKAIKFEKILAPHPTSHPTFEAAIKTTDPRRLLAKSTFKEIRGDKIVAVGWSDLHVSFLLGSRRTLKIYVSQGLVEWSLTLTTTDDCLRTADDRVQIEYKSGPEIWDRSEIAARMLERPILLFGFISFPVLAVIPDDDLCFFLCEMSTECGKRFPLLKFGYL